MQPYVLGDSHPQYCLIQAVDEHDLKMLEAQYALIKQACADNSVLLAALLVDDWNKDLSPWEAPPVFGREGFGGGARETLRHVRDELLPMLEATYALDRGDARLVVGGYSLAGLFALWAAYETDIFSACAAASPSVWFPGWIDYARAHAAQTGAVYLSLGDREEKTRNQVMAQVGRCIREQEGLLPGIKATLEWNQGNHFVDSEKRMARGFAWCINTLEKGPEGTSAGTGQ